MYKTILWDNDGVLVDTEKWYFQATKEIMKEEGFELSLEIYRDTFLKFNTGAWHLLSNKDEKYVRDLRDRRNYLYSTYLRTKDIYNNNISNILKELKNKYNMGIVTSSRKDHFDIIHNRSNLLEYFDFIITSDDFTKSKPDPEPYINAIKRTGYKENECVAIEDSERGIEAAKNANLFCFAVPNKMTQGGNFSKADIILDKLSDILLYL